MRLKSRTAFQHYEEYQGWEENQDSVHNNLLHKFNQNLSSYQQKYRKHMLLLKPAKLTQKNMNKLNLPFIENTSDHNFVLKKKQSNKKIFFNENNYSYYQQIRKETVQEGQIFQQRHSKFLRLNVVGLQKRKSHNKLREKQDVRDNSLQEMSLLKYSVKVPKIKHQNFKIREKQNYFKKGHVTNDFNDKELFAKINKQFS